MASISVTAQGEAAKDPIALYKQCFRTALQATPLAERTATKICALMREAADQCRTHLGEVQWNVHRVAVNAHITKQIKLLLKSSQSWFLP